MSQFEAENPLGQIQVSSNLRGSVQRAIKYAFEQSHRQVTLEHLLLALTNDREAAVILEASSINVQALITDVSDYLGRLNDRVGDSQRQPSLGQDVQHIIQSAGAAAKKSSRRGVSSALVLAAIVGDGRSPSAQMLNNHGLTFEHAIAALKRVNTTATEAPQPAQQAQSAQSTGLAQASQAQSNAPRLGPTTIATKADNAASSGAGAVQGQANARLQNVQAAHDIIASARERIAAARGVIAERSQEQPSAMARPNAQEPATSIPNDASAARNEDAPRVTAAPPHDAAVQPARPTQAQSTTAEPVASKTTDSVAQPSQASPPPQARSDQAVNTQPSLAAAPEMQQAKRSIGDTKDAGTANRPVEQASVAPAQAPVPRADNPARMPANPASPRSAEQRAPTPQPAGSAPQQATSVAALHSPEQLAQRPQQPRQLQQSSQPSSPMTRAPVQPGAPAMSSPPVQARRQPDPTTRSPVTPNKAGGPVAPPPAQPPRRSNNPGNQQPMRPGGPPAQQARPRSSGDVLQPDRAASPPAGSPPVRSNEARSTNVRPNQPQSSPNAPPQPLPPQQNYDRRQPGGHAGNQGVSSPNAVPGGVPPNVVRREAEPVGRAPLASDLRPIEPEKLIEDIPTRMRLGRRVTIEVRAPRAQLEAWSGSADPRVHQQIITKAMAMRLKAPDGGFTVEIASPETQWSEGHMGPLSDDVVSWRWQVTPTRRGRYRLLLSASTRVVGRDGLAAARTLPDQAVSVRVSPNLNRLAGRLALWVLVIGTSIAVGYFSENILSIGSSMLAQVSPR